MESNTNEKITHGFFDNLKFMLHELWIFEKKATVTPIVRILSDLAVSLLGIWFPKVILDTINQSASANVFLIRIGLLTIALMIF